MIEVHGDIWDYHDQGWIVIPTNLIVKSNGLAVMGAGLALQAAQRFPSLPRKLGEYLAIGGHSVSYYPEYRLFCLPTKESWREKSSLSVITDGCSTLVTQARNIEKVFLPKLGCGLGGLDWEDVKPVLERLLPGDKFVVVLEPS